MKKYFPQGIAVNEDFCNRKSERNAIKASIKSHEHLVLVAPRRYGKSSLIAQVLKENHFPSTNIDLFFTLNQAAVTDIIVEAISQIIASMLPKTQSACRKIIDAMLALNPKLTINLFGQKVEISAKQSNEKTIADVLLALDHAAAKMNKSCVVVFDEFQQIAELKESHAIEAAIRHAVERSRRVSYIFCGSKRHLLNEMFSNQSRPLYHLCDLMQIDRINASDYKVFLNNMADSKWQQPLHDDVVSEILYLSENHPYYVNALCRRLWRNSHPPLLAEVRNTWDHYVTQQASWIANDITNLTLNRKKLLTSLAFQATNEPQSQAFSTKVGLAPSAIKKALTDLHRLDWVLRTSENYYHVLDPAVAYFIRQRAS